MDDSFPDKLLQTCIEACPFQREIGPRERLKVTSPVEGWLTAEVFRIPDWLADLGLDVVPEEAWRCVQRMTFDAHSMTALDALVLAALGAIITDGGFR